MNKPIIQYNSPEAATFQTVSGWVSSDGRWWGKDEHTARYAGCTHKECPCGEVTEKHYTKCKACRQLAANIRYETMPYKEWDEVEPIVLYDDDRYFFSVDDLADWCAADGIDPDTLQLVICTPNVAFPVNGDEYYSDVLPEDSSLEDMSPRLAEAFEALNKIIAEEKPILSWAAGKFRTKWNPSGEIRAEIAAAQSEAA